MRTAGRPPIAPGWPVEFGQVGKFHPTDLFEGGLYNGFYFDFTKNSTGASIASVTSEAPPSTTAAQGTGGARPTWNAGGYASFDGLDDNLLTSLNPTAAMTACMMFRIGTASRFCLGSDNSNSRSSILGLNASGQSVAAIGSDSSAGVIHGSVDRRGTDIITLVKYTTGGALSFYENGVLQYSGSTNGTPNTVRPLALGAINGSGTIQAFADGVIYRAFAITREIEDSRVLPLMRSMAIGLLQIG